MNKPLDICNLPAYISGVGKGPSELSEASIENICIALINLRDKDNKIISIQPNQAIFTKETLVRWFGWTERDFQEADDAHQST